MVCLHRDYAQTNEDTHAYARSNSAVKNLNFFKFYLKYNLSHEVILMSYPEITSPLLELLRPFLFCMLAIYLF